MKVHTVISLYLICIIKNRTFMFGMFNSSGQQAGKKVDTGRTEGARGKDPSLGRHQSLQTPSHGRSCGSSDSQSSVGQVND